MMRMYGKRQVTEWTLKLGSIPNVTDSQSGKEVIIQFQTPQIANNKTFYTDSNGLEMQQRILDYRPTWNFSSYLNVTQNYYPVDSAIAIRDQVNGNQMTVMTTRSHGGSSIMEGQIEIMHHRRLYCDDSRGVGEPLNETDVYGNGIRVTTTYYLHLFNSKNETSQQRPWQMHIDDPVQYYYNFGFNVTSQSGTQFMRLPNTLTLQSVGFPTETGKLNIVGQAQNLLLVRLTNYADKFDNATGGPVPYVNIRSIATALYQSANPGAQVPLISIIETSITGNQPYSTMTYNKINWKGIDDGQINPPILPQDQSADVIALEAQRIRVFKITYQVSSNQSHKPASFLGA